MTPKLGDYILWDGNLAKIEWMSDRPTVGIRMVEPDHCPHCKGVLKRHYFDVIPTSPLFQEKAKPVQTMGDKTQEI